MKHTKNIHIELWPSINEMEKSNYGNIYLGNLTEFYTDIETLYSDFEKEEIYFDKIRDLNFENGIGNSVSRSAPPIIVEIIAWLSSSGIAISIYKILKLWVEHKNGRKIKLKFKNFEIETTQLNKNDFFKLLEEINEFQTDLENSQIDNKKYAKKKEKLLKRLEKSGYSIQDIDSLKRMNEFSKIKHKRK